MAVFQSLSSLSAEHILLCGLLLLFIYIILTATYNLWLHPLAKFPGPKLAAISPIWYAKRQLSGTCPQDTSSLHEIYGPVVRIAPDELSFNNPVAWKEIYGHRKPSQPELTKDKKYHSGLEGEPNILNSDRDYHGYIRKLLAHGFSDSALRQQETVIQDYINKLLQQLAERGNKGKVALDMRAWYNYFTFDIIGYLTYGESFGCLENSDFHPWITLFFSFAQVLAYSQIASRLPSFMRKPFLLWHITPGIQQSKKTEAEIATAKVEHRLGIQTDIPDFMGKLIGAYEASKMSLHQLEQNARILMGAGSETTATALSHTTHLLMTHPRVEQKLNAEIRRNFSNSEEITMSSVNSCDYLLAVIDEALRMVPPSPAAHPRYAPPGGIEIDGHFVPEGMAVGVTTYAMHHSPDNFRRPNDFVPERWTGEMSEFANDRREAMQAFSYGPRNCIGRNLAYAELKMVLARLLWQFDLEDCSPPDWRDQKVYMLWRSPPLMVKIRPRDDLE